jgi:hypothetical protein
MIPLLLIFVLGLIAYIIRTVINIFELIPMLTKDKEIASKPNELENNYQFIKGLY